jgi:pilus assembly protein Flp/PilA
VGKDTVGGVLARPDCNHCNQTAMKLSVFFWKNRRIIENSRGLTQSANQHGKGVTHMLYLPREEGQGLVEYALILVLVAIVVIVILALLGPAIGNIFSNIYSNV